MLPSDRTQRPTVGPVGAHAFLRGDRSRRPSLNAGVQICEIAEGSSSTAISGVHSKSNALVGRPVEAN